MAKAIKSFNVEKETYDALVSMFKKYKASTSVSSYVEKCLAQLLANISETEEELKDSKHYPEIMGYVIDKVVHNGFEIRASGSHYTQEKPESLEGKQVAGSVEDMEIQAALEKHKKEEEEWTWVDPEEEEEQEMIRDARITDLIEEYEAYKQNLPLIYFQMLRSDNYELSRDRRFVIEKGTGKRFINVNDNRVIQVVERAKVTGLSDEK